MNSKNAEIVDTFLKSTHFRDSDESSSKSSNKSSSKAKSTTSNDSDDEDSVEQTNTNVPDTASNDNNGFVKLNYFTVSAKNSIKVGDSTKIIVKYYPENASIKDTTFTSLNNNCTVTSLGKVTGLNKGTCSILVKVSGQSAKSLLLTVK